RLLSFIFMYLFMNFLSPTFCLLLAMSLPEITLHTPAQYVAVMHLQLVCHPVPGSDVVLPCSVRELVNPNIMVNAVDLTVPCVQNQTLRDFTDQIPSYRGRTAVFKEELKNGDVSLKLSNVRICDEGEYRCRVDSTSWRSDKTIKLSVEGKLITMEKYESGKFSLLCESKGWHPEPELQWRNSKGVNLTAETETQAVADLFNVKSRITVEKIDSFFCSVTQRHHEKEERIDAQSLHGELLHTPTHSFKYITGQEGKSASLLPPQAEKTAGAATQYDHLLQKGASKSILTSCFNRVVRGLHSIPAAGPPAASLRAAEKICWHLSPLPSRTLYSSRLNIRKPCRLAEILPPTTQLLSACCHQGGD
uniref:Ig-like domain-containing protein n=1 Tax=Astyanax mexicanus TaxID=7994 RepID=A0A3B1JXQ6_ASTMX